MLRRVYATTERLSVRLSVPSTAAAFGFISVAGATAQQQAGSVNTLIRGGSTRNCFSCLNERHVRTARSAKKTIASTDSVGTYFDSFSFLLRDDFNTITTDLVNPHFSVLCARVRDK